MSPQPDFWTIKTRARRDIHAAFVIPCFYQDATMAAAAPVHVRWHDRQARPLGNLPGGDYAEVTENIERVIFSEEELATAGVTPMRNGQLTFPNFGNFRLVLDAREPLDGPIKEIWTVQRPKQTAPPPQPQPAASDLTLGSDPLTLGPDQLVLGSDG